MSMILQVVQVHDATTTAAIITTIGLVVVALIGVLTAKVTTGAKRGAMEASENAAESANAAKGYAEALKAKDEFIGSLRGRLAYIERRLDDCERRERRDFGRNPARERQTKEE